MRLLNSIFLVLLLMIHPILSFAKSSTNQQHPIIFQVKEEQIKFDKNTVESASIVTNANGSFGGLNIFLRPDAAKQLADLTANNIGKAAELLYNDKKITTILIGLQLNKQFIITEISKNDAQSFVNSLL